MLKRQQEHIIFAKNSKTKENRREVKEKSSFSSIQILFRRNYGSCVAYALQQSHPNISSSRSFLELIFTQRATLQRQFRLYIPFLGIARRQPQFPNSCVCENLYIPRIGPHISSQQKRQTHRGNI
jgi:hypothetical protein